MKSYQIWYTYSRPWGELKFWSWVTSDQRSRSQTTLKTHILTAYSCLYIRHRTLKLGSFVSILELFFKKCLMNDLEVTQGQRSRSFVKILSFCEFSWYMSCFLCSKDKKILFLYFLDLDLIISRSEILHFSGNSSVIFAQTVKDTDLWMKYVFLLHATFHPVPKYLVSAKGVRG